MGDLLLFFVASCISSFVCIVYDRFFFKFPLVQSSLWKSCCYRLLYLFCFVCFLGDIFLSFSGFDIMLWLAGLLNGDVFVVG